MIASNNLELQIDQIKMSRSARVEEGRRNDAVPRMRTGYKMSSYPVDRRFDGRRKATTGLLDWY